MLHIHDVKLNKIFKQPITNEWIIENRLPHVKITSNKTQITANGTDKAIVRFQIVSSPLLDQSQPNLGKILPIKVKIDKDEIDLITNESGYAEVEVTAVFAKDYPIEVFDYEHNAFLIKAV